MQLRAEKEPHNKWCDWGKLFRLSSDVKLHRKRHVCGISPFKRTSRSVSRIESGFSGLCSAASLFFILNSPCCFIIVTGHRYLFHMSTCSTRTAVENILGQAESNSTFGSSSYGFVLLYLGGQELLSKFICLSGFSVDPIKHVRKDMLLFVLFLTIFGNNLLKS